MKIYTMSTNSHDFLYKEIFRKSVLKYEKDAQIKLYHYDQLCPSGIYYKQGWKDMMEKKIDIYNKAVNSNDDFFIWSDVDIEFYKPFIDQCLEELSDNDIAFEKGLDENLKNEYCPGFFISRINQKTKKFFQKLKETYGSYPCDKESINQNLKTQDIAITYLSDKFLNASHELDKWNSKQEINIPNITIMFHASYVIGIENKIAILDKARETMQHIDDNTIKILSAEYGVFEDVTENLKTILIGKNKIKISPKILNQNISSNSEVLLYLYDKQHNLITSQPIHYDRHLTICKNS